MGFLNQILGTRPAAHQPPAGTITISPGGELVSSTVSSAYPVLRLCEIGREMLLLFREAREAHMPLAEISMHYASLRITARELRGGAVIFLFPQNAQPPATH
jgi:hypothetical protein